MYIAYISSIYSFILLTFTTSRLPQYFSNIFIYALVLSLILIPISYIIGLGHNKYQQKYDATISNEALKDEIVKEVVNKLKGYNYE